jgi:hypothetical protein
MADNQEARARALMDSAYQKQTSSSFFEFFATNNSKFEEAGEMYTKAANLFKIAKKCMDTRCVMICSSSSSTCFPSLNHPS